MVNTSVLLLKVRVQSWGQERRLLKILLANLEVFESILKAFNNLVQTISLGCDSATKVEVLLAKKTQSPDSRHVTLGT